MSHVLENTNMADLSFLYAIRAIPFNHASNYVPPLEDRITGMNLN
jgi:hypothetical protein